MGTNSQLISDLFQRTILYLTSCSSWKSIRSSSKLWSFVLFCLSLFPALAHQKNVASCTLLSCRWNRPLLAFLLISKIICHIYIMVWFLTTFFYKSLGVLTQFNSDEWLLFYGSKAWLNFYFTVTCTDQLWIHWGSLSQMVLFGTLFLPKYFISLSITVPRSQSVPRSLQRTL